VAALCDEDRQAVRTAADLQALMRKQLIRPRHDDPGDEDALEFSHALARDAAYQLIARADRVELHERFAAWAERTLGEGGAGYEEIVGYHLEKAHDTLLELGPESPARPSWPIAPSPGCPWPGCPPTRGGTCPRP
jgi:predicted ATPase